MVTFDELKRRFIHLNNKDLLLAFDNTKPGMARDACATIILDRVNRYSTVDTLRIIEERDALRAELEKVHGLLRAWRATVSIERDSRGENPVIATMVHNNQGRELNAAGVALAEYVDSLEVTE